MAMPHVFAALPPQPENLVPWYGQPVDMGDDDRYTLDGSVRSIKMGLGWDAGCDVDGSVSLFDWHGNNVENVYYGDLESKCGAVKHSGDDRTGEGGGDDEVITIDLDALPFTVARIVASVTVFTGGCSFADVRSCHVRMMHGKSKHEGKVLCSYALSKRKGNALILAVLARQGAWWVLQALGKPTTGRTVKDIAGCRTTPALLNRLPAFPPEVKRITVTVLEGRNLAAKDKNLLTKDSSDPYYKVKYSGMTGGAKVKTKYKSEPVMNSLNPSWPIHPVHLGFVIASEHKKVKITVYDYDSVSSPDFMGRVSVPAAALFNAPSGEHEHWFTLTTKTKAPDKRVSGEILVRWSIVDVPFESLLY